MNARRTRGMVAALLFSALVTSACGLKPEVKDSLAQGGGGSLAGAGAGTEALVEETFEDTDGDGLDDTSGLDAAALEAATGAEATSPDPAAAGAPDAAAGDPAAAGAPAASGGGGGGGAAPAKPGAPAPQQQGAKPAGPNSKVGVDDKAKTIRISLHGPLTGAGVPQDSFVSGTPKYWEGRKVKGYKVIAEAFDDKYQAGPAVKACNARASKDFLIIGGAGTDQIQACARSTVLQRGNVPYLSAGVTENGLGGLNHYFATSLSYKQQGRLVVDMARKGGYLNPKNGKGWAVVISNTPNFLDAEQGFLAALQAAGQKAKVIRTPKTGADSTSVANQLREGQFESVFFLGQPLFFIELVTKVGCPAYCPQWAGPGVSMGTDSIGRPACQGSNNQYKGEFLSPGPGLDQAGKLAPGVKFKDDIEWGIYSAMQGIETLLNAVPGEGFTREGFIAAVNGKSFKGQILPDVNFTKSRFGGTAAYSLRMKCGQGHITTGKYS